MEINKIINGDCREVLKTFSNDSLDVAFTSPPYNRKQNDKYKEYDDVLDDYLSLIVDTTNEMLRICKKLVIVNIQSTHWNKTDVNRYIGIFADKIKGIVIWEKNNPQPSWNEREREEVKTYSVSNAYEYFFVLGEDNNEFRAYSKIYNTLHTNVNDVHFKGHGAVMKLEVAEHFIKNFTLENDTVLDCFFGLGTTGVACKKLHRNYVGIEQSKEYCERAERRIEIEGNTLF